jgi:hypothetical protein
MFQKAVGIRKLFDEDEDVSAGSGENMSCIRKCFRRQMGKMHVKMF